MKTAVLLSLLAALAFAALALAMAPNLLLMPQRDHAPDDIALAYRLRALAPIATVVLAIAAAALAALIWKQPRRPGPVPVLLRSVLLLVLILPAFGSVLLSRATMVERMFAPLDQARFAGVDGAGAGEEELVMGIEIEGEARAYPVRIVGYHHIIHDTVGGEPVVATY